MKSASLFVLTGWPQPLWGFAMTEWLIWQLISDNRHLDLWIAPAASQLRDDNIGKPAMTLKKKADRW